MSSATPHHQNQTVPPSPRITARGPTPPQSPALQVSGYRRIVNPHTNTAQGNSNNNNNGNNTNNENNNNHMSMANLCEVEIPFNVARGEIIANKYEVVCLIGRGTFSSVYGCRVLEPFPHLPFGIHHTNPYIPSNIKISDDQQVVAMKVIRDVERYRKAAEKEIGLLEMLKQNSNSNAKKNNSSNQGSGCIELVDYFLWSSRYVCMVFPLHGSSLYDFLYRNHFLPFFPAHLQEIARQICTTLAHLEEINIIHADLKPENLLFVDSAYDNIPVTSNLSVHVPHSPAIKFIDFGTAALNTSSHKAKIVASRSYRPPEVILELGWSFGVDIWSAGCILYELYTGMRLFNLNHTCTDLEHLRMMESILGPLPENLKNSSPVFAYEKIVPFDNDSTSFTQSCITPNPPTHHELTNYMNSTYLLKLATDYQQNMDECDTEILNNANSNVTINDRKMGLNKSDKNNQNEDKATGLAHGGFDKNVPSLRFIDHIDPQDTLLGDLISKMLAYDPAERITAKQALNHPYFH